MNPRRLFVGNLAYSVDEKQLFSLFSRYGEVLGVRIIEGKGYGFVEMESYEDVRAARNALNETEFQGRNLLIDDVRPPKNKPGFQKGSGRKYQSGRSNQGKHSEKSGQRSQTRTKSARSGYGRPGISEYSERTLRSVSPPPGRNKEQSGRAVKNSPVSQKKDDRARDSRSIRVKPEKEYSSTQKKSKPRFWPGGKR
ncbi:MAG: RNA-binding protein [Methanomicrobiales archaeon]|nr:RNA-binding protein [Methanomicrobiales archaeon]